MTIEDRLTKDVVRSLTKSLIRTRICKDLIISDLICARAYLQSMQEIEDDLLDEIYEEISSVITHLQKSMLSIDQETLDYIAAILHKFQANLSKSDL